MLFRSQFELGKPRFLYTSSIHGDELTGYVLMLHLIDYLLSGYGSDQRITSMLNNTEIWINPLANPDGTYHGGNNTVFGATRFNANNIDLNRNFPDPAAGPHPDGNSWQQETVNFMSFADTNHFVQSMNFHGGSQVFNYPWDTWAKLHPDNSWFNYLGREWADTVHKYAPSGYMTDMDNGVTNGYAWYRITGGRQDYMTYFQYGREVTLEISTIKTPSASQLPNYWNYNYHSFLNYIEQAEYGINGQITDTITGEPLSAKVTITTHDFDNSQVYSYLPSGWYFRPVYQGNYTLNFTADGYFPKTVTNVGSTNLSTTRLNVQMVPLNISVPKNNLTVFCKLFPNPAHHWVNLKFSNLREGVCDYEIRGVTGQILLMDRFVISEDSAKLELKGLAKGMYLLKIWTRFESFTTKLFVE